MSENMDVHITTLDVGAFSGATEIPLAFVPTDGGGITVLSAHMSGTVAGTAIGAKLVVMTNVGTPAVASTIGAFAGTVVTAAGVVFAATIGTAYVGAAKWIGYDQTSGTLPAGCFISLAYTMGK